MPITTKVVSSNPAHGEVYPIQHYVIKFVIDLRRVGGFFRVIRFPDRQDIAEILLKVALNTITLIPCDQSGNPKACQYRTVNVFFSVVTSNLKLNEHFRNMTSALRLINIY